MQQKMGGNLSMVNFVMGVLLLVSALLFVIGAFDKDTPAIFLIVVGWCLYHFIDYFGWWGVVVRFVF